MKSRENKGHPTDMGDPETHENTITADEESGRKRKKRNKRMNMRRPRGMTLSKKR